MTGSFEAFARHCDLACRAERIGAAPRDLLAPLHAAEQHYLVFLSKRDTPETGPVVRMVFAKPLTDPDGPALRDVLWWLAGDAFAVDQADGQLAPWAASYGHPPHSPESARLFEVQREQTHQLRILLGEVAYRRLLELYESELSQAAR